MEKNDQQQILDRMQVTGLVPVFNHENAEVAKQVLDASYRGGVRVFEFTNRGANALEIFTELAEYARQYDDLNLGIGTIFSATDAEAFLRAGADFMVSPAFVPEVANHSNDRSKLWIPGCGTVTEIYNALQYRAKLIKVFPGNVLGAGFVKSVKAVYPKVPIMPTGGVVPNEENLSAWFGAGVHCVGMGSQLFDKEIIATGDFESLGKTISDALKLIKKIKG